MKLLGMLEEVRKAGATVSQLKVASAPEQQAVSDESQKTSYLNPQRNTFIALALRQFSY